MCVRRGRGRGECDSPWSRGKREKLLVLLYIRISREIIFKEC